MKRIVKIASLFLVVALAFGCQEKLDTVGGQSMMFTATYMGTDMVTAELNDNGGEAIVEPRLVAPALQDTKITLSAQDFFKQYNKANNTKYQMLPTSEYELYEVANPKNISTNGKITVNVTKGNYASPVGIRIKALDEQKFPFGTKYAIPLEITSSSADYVTPDKQTVITLNRAFKTDVMKIKQGYGLKIKLSDSIQATKEFTVQGQFMFLGWASQNQTTMVVGGYYTRVNSNGIQVKDGAGDGDATWYNKEGGMKKNTWYQITFTYKDNDFKVYLNGELVKTFVRPDLEVKPEQLFHLFNPQPSYSANQYVREVRLWNRVLTEKEIKDDLYLPVDPNSEGLLMYLPLDKTNKIKNIAPYKNEVMPKKGKGLDHETISVEDFEKQGIEWVDNVKFPAEGLEIIK